MARKQNSSVKDPYLAYKLLDKWLYDGSKTSPIPKEVVDDKKIGPNHLLYFFKGHHIVYISKYFNNFGVYQLDRLEIFKMIKDIIQRSAYVPPPNKRRYKVNRSKIFKELWRKYPYLKPDDINLLAEKLEDMECRDAVFEMFGLEKPKKVKERKTKKKPKKKDTNTMESLLENFELVKE